uniref:Uncharacterized protein n=1 Tax=Megaselia scalaris TaxID=36166 RepID=T1H1S1_MEGSC
MKNPSRCQLLQPYLGICFGMPFGIAYVLLRDENKNVIKISISKEYDIWIKKTTPTMIINKKKGDRSFYKEDEVKYSDVAEMYMMR